MCGGRPPRERHLETVPFGLGRAFARLAGHREQRAASVRHRGRHECARRPRAQLPAALKRGAEPGAARSQDRRVSFDPLCWGSSRIGAVI
jgi:hypothetical protein